MTPKENEMKPEKTIETNNQLPPIPQEAFDWYDEYAHGDIDRREFLRRLNGIALGALTMTVLTSSLIPNYAEANQVSFNDSEILASFEELDSPNGHGTGRGYLVKPTNMMDTAPAVLVVHENRGLNPYIKDVARRLAKAGFLAFAPDALHPLGGYPGNDDVGRSMQKSLDRSKIEQDFIAAAKFLKSHSLSNGSVGAVGFCFGGYICNMLSAAIPEDISASVPFYGTPAKEPLVQKVKGPLLMHYAVLDKRVNKSKPAYEALLKDKGENYTMRMYPGVNHGFHNDSTGRYNEQAAELAWSRTIKFFEENLDSNSCGWC